ncbi:MAG TPA: porin [Tepidisphaeraceae bacterium]
MTKRRTISALVAAALVGLGATAASRAADQPAGGATNQQDMQKQLEALQQQVKDLQAQRAASGPAFSAKDVDATVDSVLRDADRRSQMLAETGGFYGGWMDDRFSIRSADGNYVFSPWIQMQFRSVTTYNDNATASGDANTDNGFEMRRIKLGFDGNAFSKDFTYSFVWATDRKTGNLVNEEAYGQYKFADNFAVKFGQYKEYIYHEQTISSKRQMAADRSLLNEVLNGGESYTQGVDLLWDSNGPFRADIAFTDGYASRNTNFQDPPTNGFDFGVHGRAEWMVFGKDFKGYGQFTSLGNKSGDFLVLGAGGDWSQNGDINVYHHNVDAQWNMGPIGLYAAYVGLYTDPGSGGSSAWDWGFLVQASYLINNQWELFGRYDYMHLDGTDSAIAHGTEDTFHEITVGLNYYLHGHSAKITIDAGWLPNGSPNNQDGIGVLANDGENEYYLRGQFQLLL